MLTPDSVENKVKGSRPAQMIYRKPAIRSSWLPHYALLRRSETVEQPRLPRTCQRLRFFFARCSGVSTISPTCGRLANYGTCRWRWWIWSLTLAKRVILNQSLHNTWQNRQNESRRDDEEVVLKSISRIKQVRTLAAPPRLNKAAAYSRINRALLDIRGLFPLCHPGYAHDLSERSLVGLTAVTSSWSSSNRKSLHPGCQRALKTFETCNTRQENLYYLNWTFLTKDWWSRILRICLNPN